MTSATLSTSTNYGGSNYYLSTSDRRLKSGLSPIANAMSTIRKLKGVYYYWSKDAQKGVVSGSRTSPPSISDNEKTNDAASEAQKDGNSSSLRGSSTASVLNIPPTAHSSPVIATRFDDRRHVGFIAQDVQEALPEAVSEMHGNRYLGVDYGAIVPVLVGAVQEMDKKVEAVQASPDAYPPLDEKDPLILTTLLRIGQL